MHFCHYGAQSLTNMTLPYRFHIFKNANSKSMTNLFELNDFKEILATLLWLYHYTLSEIFNIFRIRWVFFFVKNSRKIKKKTHNLRNFSTFWQKHKIIFKKDLDLDITFKKESLCMSTMWYQAQFLHSPGLQFRNLTPSHGQMSWNRKYYIIVKNFDDFLNVKQMVEILAK